MEFNLSDALIAQIAKSLQVAMITGTDIVDNLRLIKVEISDNEIVPTSGSKKSFQEGIERMMEEVESNQDLKSVNEK